MPETPARRFSLSSIGLHWMTFLLVVAVYAAIELREYYPRGSMERDALKAWHGTLGLTVLGLTLARIVARLLGPTPEIVPRPPAWHAAAAIAMHFALYILLLAMPLLGWAILSAEGATPYFWGLHLPPLTAPDKELAEWLEEWHETLGKIGYALIGLHALAAIVHQVVQRDNTMRRMLPGR